MLVRVKEIKLNDITKYVELYVEDLRTRVRFPPVPPIKKDLNFFKSFFFWGVLITLLVFMFLRLASIYQIRAKDQIAFLPKLQT